VASTDISNLMVISMKEISTKLKLFKVLVNQRINSNTIIKIKQFI